MSRQRKTRQEKIIADLRRKLATTQEKTLIPKDKLPIPSSPQVPPTPSKPPEQKTAINTNSLYALPVAGIKKDLTKTAALAIFAISLEFVLFFLLG